MLIKKSGKHPDLDAQFVRAVPNIDADLYEEFISKAKAEGRSVTWLITRYIEGYVSRGE